MSTQTKPARLLDPDDLVFEKYFSSPQGKFALAKAMMQPLRTTRDYETCPSCGTTVIIDHKGREHPDNGCPLRTIIEIMDS